MTTCAGVVQLMWSPPEGTTAAPDPVCYSQLASMEIAMATVPRPLSKHSCDNLALSTDGSSEEAAAAGAWCCNRRVEEVQERLVSEESLLVRPESGCWSCCRRDARAFERPVNEEIRSVGSTSAVSCQNRVPLPAPHAYFLISNRRPVGLPMALTLEAHRG